jgi:putative membrane protein
MKDLLSLLAVWSIVLSGLALLVGLFLIRRGDRVNHHRAMLTATALAALFLVFYLAKWALHGTTAYGGPEAWKGVYYFILITHTLLAALNGPLASTWSFGPSGASSPCTSAGPGCWCPSGSTWP